MGNDKPDPVLLKDQAALNQALKSGHGVEDAWRKLLQDDMAVQMKAQLAKGDKVDAKSALSAAEKDLVTMGILPPVDITSGYDVTLKTAAGVAVDIHLGADWLQGSMWVAKTQDILVKDQSDPTKLDISLDNVTKEVGALQDRLAKGYTLTPAESAELTALVAIQNYADQHHLNGGTLDYSKYLHDTLAPNASDADWGKYTHTFHSPPDTVGDLAKAAGMSVADFKAMNHIPPDSNNIANGQIFVMNPKLLEPLAASAVTNNLSTADKPNPNGYADDTNKYFNKGNPTNIRHLSGPEGQAYKLNDGDLITKGNNQAVAIYDSQGKLVGKVTSTDGNAANFTDIGQGKPFAISDMAGTFEIGTDGKLQFIPPADGKANVTADELAQLKALGVVSEVTPLPANLQAEYTDSAGDKFFVAKDGTVIETVKGQAGKPDESFVTINGKVYLATDLSSPSSSDGGFTFKVAGCDATLSIDKNGILAPQDGINSTTLKQLAQLGLVTPNGAYERGGTFINTYKDARGDYFTDMGNGITAVKLKDGDTYATLPDGTKAQLSTADYDLISSGKFDGSISFNSEGKAIYNPPTDGSNPDAATLSALADLKLATHDVNKGVDHYSVSGIDYYVSHDGKTVLESNGNGSGTITMNGKVYAATHIEIGTGGITFDAANTIYTYDASGDLEVATF